MSFTDRSEAAFLGLALGDAYGRPLEFVTGSRVRTQVVSTRRDEFVWTDDTHMALYLAEAVLQSGADVLSADAFGKLVGEAFLRWLNDPFMPSTAPGNTCLAGARAWQSNRDWRVSGVASSDGCGAVMRICPLAIAFAGNELMLAAEVSARITHGHPNATNATQAACMLTRWALEAGDFTAEMVERAATISQGSTRAALLAALVEGQKSTPFLDERAIPDGDGGWRSPSALGLAVASVLRGGTFEEIVDRAARIDGDSDSVACLAGMLVGASRGLSALPAAWVQNVHRSAEIREVARALSARGCPTLVVADLHGHRTHFDALLVWAETQGVDHTVLLGDYCDNGPDMLGLFERLVNRPKTTAIVGNHDLAALRAAGLGGAPPNPEWYERWNSRYGKTLAAVLGAVSADDLADRFPAGVRVWLESLPWVAETPRYCFVHAGMEPESLRPQVQALHARTLPDNPEFHPAPISKKELAKVGSLAWDRVVVSGHKNLHGPCAFVGPNRICLSAEVDQTGVLHAVILPQRRFVAIGRDLVVRDVQPPGGEAA